MRLPKRPAQSWSARRGIWRCDLAGGDFSQMLKSLKRLHDLPGDYKVLPGHESMSTLEEERQWNPYMLQATQ